MRTYFSNAPFSRRLEQTAHLVNGHNLGDVPFGNQSRGAVIEGGEMNTSRDSDNMLQKNDKLFNWGCGGVGGCSLLTE